MKPVVVGIIGAGVISGAYLKGVAHSRFAKVKSIADLLPEAAQQRAAEFGCQAVTIAELLADTEIEIVVNLTIPTAHAPVDLDILAAGKHVYSEKPLSASLYESDTVLREADRRNLRVGCAPDTFFGASHQVCRQIVDEGRIGRIVGGSVVIASRGMEHWHPDPRFFYQPGGGPHADVGPYYITQLVNLLGPVATVSAITSRAFEQRTITSEKLNGVVFDVRVPTTLNGNLLFASGANVSLTMSWDIWASKRPRFEIYGTEGSLQNPDPNHFGGTPEVALRGGDWEPIPISDFAFGQPNRTTILGQEVADYRAVGLIDMAIAMRENRPHRANSALAYHVLEVLEALESSYKNRSHVDIVSRCSRPDPLGLGNSEEILATAAFAVV
ncbi:Gfo/Idh/MocA family oxidoreductase (plasmid) [Agrobacterium leguminum]|uniref:Oxidoreductase domain protein n=1 Tax=Agrobacterium deltaense NCPPB 1641 TaxID=1183425 RepID=A0A1S7U8U1_9HYPH|nr:MULTISPECIES: Gfo/Idh/MocA family oxidoreductase [Agrobacterium]WFS70047.1 Gfo/Idh/MocA family oxidoreductase [Agrobacterium leguminum]CVI63346.1 Oxidoreductase domain protein [Agrobacterium deltaense NCPPB 1641]